MFSPGRILIYAELLSNIRQISVGCLLPSECAPETTAFVSDDGWTMTIRHQRAESSVRLPGRVNAPQTLPMPNRRARDLAWRLPLATPGRPAVPVSADSQAAPWSAQDIKSNSTLRCRACRTVVVPEGAITVWKDLPSENWAEMMEFWHCHKPHDHGQDDHDHLDSKGYGANSRLAGQTGVGLVDLTSFLFSRLDCRNLVVSTDVVPIALPHNPRHGCIEGGQTSVIAFQWRGHRYSHPRMIFMFPFLRFAVAEPGSWSHGFSFDLPGNVPVSYRDSLGRGTLETSKGVHITAVARSYLQ